MLIQLLVLTARDIQAWEYVPLGPFLGKSFGKQSYLLVPLLEFFFAINIIAKGPKSLYVRDDRSHFYFWYHDV